MYLGQVCYSRAGTHVPVSQDVGRFNHFLGQKTTWHKPQKVIVTTEVSTWIIKQVSLIFFWNYIINIFISIVYEKYFNTSDYKF